MRTFQQIGPMRSYLRGIRSEGKSVGFVPTMGALHEGHLTLMRRAKGDCDLVVASIFVNPLQFAPGEDFERYPRDTNRDLPLASEAGVDALFLPAVEEMYPQGFDVIVDVPALGSVLEGAHRPGHFRGVATVVTKLLNIVQPDRAYFGQKDFQQLLLIDRLVHDLNLQTSVTLVPTVREPDGLALSSRNVYLSSDERQAAPVLYRVLLRAQELLTCGTTDALAVQRELETMLDAQPLARREYVALVHPDTLAPVKTLGDGITLVAMAVHFGKTRLIDNYFIAPEGVQIAKYRLGKL